ncbi:putative FBD-associated F-box protein At3g50710 [Neltuma alba]|uniref:putative FBD-associated F-box protein At3g50710 n=1 Tax=Neltuma alba TaxID=207710 RepID=UPI0010A3A983|nr:putative FBD-associated F-box protein At3g50710 [Prosopis alba]
MEKSVSRKRNRREEVDRISGLPNSVLLRILSFLPVKEAVATSLLSKKWKRLWLSLPTLDLNRVYFGTLPFFYRFVSKVLKRVDLKSVENSKGELLHLELHLRRLDGYKLPSSVLLANNIRVLKLTEVKVGTLSRVNLPSLEILDLDQIDFPDYRSLEMLLSSSPLLKDLVLKILYGNLNRPLNIGRLNHLVTAEVPQCLLPLKVLSNVSFLRLCWTPDLWSFSDDMPTFHNLTHLECVAGEWTRMVNCFRNFPKLEKLVISEWPFYDKVDSSFPPEPILDVPPCVSLHLKEFTLLYLRGPGSKSEMLKYITENAGVLRTLTIKGVGNGDEGKLRMLQKLAAKRRGSESCSLKVSWPTLKYLHNGDEGKLRMLQKLAAKRRSESAVW